MRERMSDASISGNGRVVDAQAQIPCCCLRMGECIRRKREILGMSMQSLALRLQVEIIAIEKLEARKIVAIKIIRRVAQVMQIEAKDLTELTDEEFSNKHHYRSTKNV